MSFFKSQGLFRAFWRWHFYASFLVIPVLLLLSITGLVYLFRFQIEPALHPDLMRVQPPGGSAVQTSLASQQDAVAAAYPTARIVSLTEPRGEGDPTRFTTIISGDQTQDVFVNPWTGRVLGALNPDTTLSGYAVRLHGDLMTGKVGDAVIELGASWAIVMALTGLYLMLTGRAARKRRGIKLRQRHATVGLFVSGGLLLLVITGLPWTGFWGEKVQTLATQRGSSLWSDDPGAQSSPTSRLDESLPHSHDVPWAQGGRPVPTSGPQTASVANVDTAVSVSTAAGLAHPLTVIMPDGPDGVFSVIADAFENPENERTIHIDRYGGQIVSRNSFENYSLAAKTVAQGIAVHEGRRFGSANFALTTAFCLAVIFMCLTGPLMWWRRRPRGAAESGGRSVGAPLGRLRVRGGLAVLLLALALFLPLFGASVTAILLLDFAILRRVPLTRRWLNIA